MKNFAIFVIVTIATLCGCSSEDDLQKNASLTEESDANEALYSNVPIRFAPSTLTALDCEEWGSITRGTPSSNSMFRDAGMFCLAKRAINIGKEEGRTPTWSGAARSAILNTLSVWKKNVSVDIRYNAANKVIIDWNPDMNADYFPYYPDKDWFAYGFVMYYPRTENIKYTQTTLKAFIKLDGTKRVLYSMAKQPKTVIGNEIDDLGFSKAYYDAIDPEPGVEEYIYPYFEFENLTSALKFIMWSKEEPLTNLHVEKVEFKKFPCIMMLGLANMQRYANKMAYNMKSNINNVPFVKNDSIFEDLGLSEFTELTGPFGDYEVHEEDGSSIAGLKNDDGSYKYTLTTESKQVGGIVYIPPVYAKHSRASLRIYVTLADDEGNKYINENAIIVNPPSTGWKKGIVYPINLWLDNPAEVAKDASLAEWVAAEPIEVNATLTNWVQQP